MAVKPFIKIEKNKLKSVGYVINIGEQKHIQEQRNEIANIYSFNVFSTDFFFNK